MSKKYPGSISAIQFLPIVMLIIIGGTLLYVASMTPFPLNIAMTIIILLGFIIVIVSFVANQKIFYAEIKDDGSLKIVAAQGVKNEPEKNSIKFFGTVSGIFAKMVVSRDNILNVEVANKDDIKTFEKHSIEKYIITQNPIKRFKMGMDFLKNASKAEFEPRTGLGMFSYAFVSNTKDMVKIKLNQILVKTDFGEYRVEKPIIFFSVKNPKRFLSEFTK